MIIGECPGWLTRSVGRAPRSMMRLTIGACIDAQRDGLWRNRRQPSTATAAIAQGARVRSAPDERKPDETFQRGDTDGHDGDDQGRAAPGAVAKGGVLAFAGNPVRGRRRSARCAFGQPEAAPRLGRRPPTPPGSARSPRSSAAGLGGGHAGRRPRTGTRTACSSTCRRPPLDDGRRPVMLWIHGGRVRVRPRGAIPWYDGTPVRGGRRRGSSCRSTTGSASSVGCTSVDHDGDLAGSGKLAGLLDQIAALEWGGATTSRRFGGDPDDVDHLRRVGRRRHEPSAPSSARPRAPGAVPQGDRAERRGAQRADDDRREGRRRSP